MEKHPMAGLPVKITSGPFKDKYFIVIDFIVNQYQGKSIDKIYKYHPAMIHPVKNRMKGLDDKIVFGKLHPSMEFCCMHDTELQVTEGLRITADLDTLPPDNVVDIKTPRPPGGRKEGDEVEDNNGNVLVLGKDIWNKGAKNVSRGPSEGDSEPVEPGGAEPDGRVLPSESEDSIVDEPVKGEGQTDSKAGSPTRGSKKRPPRLKK